ncbi:NmrA family NAD(P)-binding protein [Secundilactobacillus paracollinoides]|uniref:NmrA family NAD(P)-binding protein n=1 Tax=Secundilactobacillus paracollinoides TaxID=240427 RepID=UPI0009EA7B68|nr:NmrA family NAD(P)-binding protein [Secundilactobacillus paracollinoides]
MGVLGATGLLGTATINHLIEQGVTPADIVGFYRNENKTAGLKQLGLTLRYGDYSQPSFNSDTLAGIDRLLFISSSEEDNLVRLQEHLRVVNAAKQAGVSYIAYTGMAFPNDTSMPMGNVHLATEYMIKASGINFTMMRNSFYTEVILSPEEVQFEVKTGKIFSNTNGVKLNFVARDDYAKANAKVLTTPGYEGRTLELGSNHPYTFADIASDLSSVSGHPIELVEEPAEQIERDLTALGDKNALFFYQLHAGYQDGWGAHISNDLADLIGENNITTPKQTIQDYLK